jgi:hypothetical protein
MSVCTSMVLWSVPVCVQKLVPISAVAYKNVTNKSCSLCVKSEKIYSGLPSDPLWSMKQGKAKNHTLRYCSKESQALNIKTHFSVSSSSQSQSQAVVCVSTPRMHPGCGYFLVLIKTLSYSHVQGRLDMKVF